MMRKGDYFRCGQNVIIEDDVIIGNNVTLGHNVILKNGTRIGDNVVMADNSCTSGLCWIGNNVRIRTNSCISRGTIVEDGTFIAGNVMTSHTRDIHYMRPKTEKKEYITRIGPYAVLGTGVIVRAGANISDLVIVGYGSNVMSSLEEPGVYIGNPAKFYRELKEEEYPETFPGFTQYHNFTPEEIEKYLPYCSEYYKESD